MNTHETEIAVSPYGFTRLPPSRVATTVLAVLLLLLLLLLAPLPPLWPPKLVPRKEG